MISLLTQKLRKQKYSTKGDLKTKLFVRMSTQELEKTIKNLTSLIFLRVAIISIILCANIWSITHSTGEFYQAYTTFAVVCFTYLFSILNIALLRMRKLISVVGCFQFVMDVLIATAVIYLTGSTLSISLYYIITLSSTILFSSQIALLIAASSGLAYAVVVTNLIELQIGHTFQQSTTDIAAVYLSLIIIAFIGSYLTKEMGGLKNKLNEKEKDLSALNNKQKNMLNDISEGVITLDIDECITSMNQAAKAILGLCNHNIDYLGKTVSQTLDNLELDQSEALKLITRQTEEVVGEMIISTNEHNKKQLSYNIKPIFDNEGGQNGKMLILEDVSHLRNIEEKLSLHEQVTRILANSENQDSSQNSELENCNIIGKSAKMKRVFSLIAKVSASQASVLICGESGTGKELIAQAIHKNSSRKDKPFVAINCGAIPENLIESELFGHKKGSFTGAVSDNLGLFRKANGSTIFLDEIGELPPQLQTKLLRVLQEKKVRPVGDTKDYEIDVRVVAATNKDLKQEIKAKTFREDLYYRLNVVHIPVPTLKERKEDIPLLISHFIKKHSKDSENTPQVSPDVLDLLIDYHYPGNIRELENIIERALVVSGKAITREHLSEDILESREFKPSVTKYSQKEVDQTEILDIPVDLETLLAELEKKYLIEALLKSEGVKKNAAKLLGINFRSFRYRLKKYGLVDEDSL